MATATEKASTSTIEVIEEATVRFCGDSGDGMQLAGTQLTSTSALAGNDVATFPDFPAEIRAPRGTKAGVSGFQIHFSSKDIFTPGDRVDALVAMNPAALVTNIADLRKGGILIANEGAFGKKALGQAGYEQNPLEDESLGEYRLYKVDMTKLTRAAVVEQKLSNKESDRCRNFFAMGLVYWLYDRSLDPTMRYIETKFGKRPEIAAANTAALKAGYHFGDTIGAMSTQYHVDKAELPPGEYTNMEGNKLLAWGLLTAAQKSNKRLFLGAYPITPASSVLEELSKHKNFDVLTFQAEDEIAAMASTVGAAYTGEMAVTSTSGPGIALKGEAMGLAVITELPMVIINVQRGGPCTGLPTKVEQADLLQAMYGRNGECPIPIIAAKNPASCFEVAQEAWRLAVRFMTPVLILTDSYIANGSEPWRIPNLDDIPELEIKHPGPIEEGETFLPYERNERLARPWTKIGTPTLMHRIGGLEKADITGNVSYDPLNHQHMIETRAKKVEGIANDIPLQEVEGDDDADLLVLSWGGTYGACVTATRAARKNGQSVAHAHLTYMYPFPRNLEEIINRYEKILIPELNMGQLQLLIQGKFVKETIGFHKTQGKPFAVSEIAEKIDEILA